MTKKKETPAALAPNDTSCTSTPIHAPPPQTKTLVIGTWKSHYGPCVASKDHQHIMEEHSHAEADRAGA